MNPHNLSIRHHWTKSYFHWEEIENIKYSRPRVWSRRWQCSQICWRPSWSMWQDQARTSSHLIIDMHLPKYEYIKIYILNKTSHLRLSVFIKGFIQWSTAVKSFMANIDLDLPTWPLHWNINFKPFSSSQLIYSIQQRQQRQQRQWQNKRWRQGRQERQRKNNNKDNNDNKGNNNEDYRDNDIKDNKDK